MYSSNSGAERIRQHLEKYAITSYMAQKLAGSSGDRTLRRIMEKDKSKYRYVEIKGENSNYRAWFLKDNIDNVLIINRISVLGRNMHWYLVNISSYDIKQTKSTNTNKSLKQQIKELR